jgi:hypothetical protein
MEPILMGSVAAPASPALGMPTTALTLVKEYSPITV